jgi:hypothetical protein
MKQMSAATRQIADAITTHGGKKMMVATSEMGTFFQRYTHITTHDGTKTGRPWNKVKVQEPVGDGQYLVKVLMLHGVVLPEPFETVDTLAHAFSL